MSENNKELNFNDQNKLDILKEKLNKFTGCYRYNKL